jgi:hypothetical protein
MELVGQRHREYQHGRKQPGFCDRRQANPEGAQAQAPKHKVFPDVGGLAHDHVNGSDLGFGKPRKKEIQNRNQKTRGLSAGKDIGRKNEDQSGPGQDRKPMGES